MQENVHSFFFFHAIYNPGGDICAAPTAAQLLVEMTLTLTQLLSRLLFLYLYYQDS